MSATLRVPRSEMGAIVLKGVHSLAVIGWKPIERIALVAIDESSQTTRRELVLGACLQMCHYSRGLLGLGRYTHRQK